MVMFPRRTSYGIFVKFRRSRLVLRRGIVRLEDALSLAEQLRAGRFHDRGDIFVVREPEGVVVEAPEPAPPSVPPVPMGDTPKPPAQPVPVDVAKPASPTPPALAGIPEARPPAETPPSASPARRAAPPRAALAEELAGFLRMIAQADNVRCAVHRARVAQARLERACRAMDHASQGHDPPPAVDLRQNRERLLDLRTSSARSVESFERVAILVERRLAVAWAEATGRAVPGR
jgi:hypothetical protein